MRRNSAKAIRRDVGRRIAEERTARGWTQEHLAERLRVSTRYLQSVEAGRENLTIDSLAKIGNVLGVKAASLFDKPEAER